MSDAAPALHVVAPSARRFRPRPSGLAGRILIALLLSMLCAAALIAISGHNPLAAFAAIAKGAVGTEHQIGASLNRSTPYLLAGVGVAICFRAGVINIGAEGQIAIEGGAAAAAAIRLGRRVHEVLATLLLNFVAILLVQQLLAGPLGQFGTGFLQSPLMPRSTWLPRLPGFDAHPGFLIAIAAAAGLSFVLWRTPFGFALRVAGSSRLAAAYAGFSLSRLTWGAMLIAGALAGLAGGVEVLGVHRPTARPSP